MSWKATLTKSLAVLVLILGLQFGGFSERQSFTLALVLWIIYSILEERINKTEKTGPITSEKSPGRITPFTIQIRPNWYLLLKDTGLIDEEHWNAFSEQILSKNDSDYSVLQAGVSFTQLQANLLYSNDHHYFFPDSDMSYGIREDIEGVSREGTFGGSQIFYVRFTEVGYEIGVTTPESRKKNSAFEPDSHLLPIATLPHEVFEYYYHPDDYDYGKPGGGERLRKYADRCKLRLSELGWNERQYDAPVNAPTQPSQYEHKYATVFVRGIE